MSAPKSILAGKTIKTVKKTYVIVGGEQVKKYKVKNEDEIEIYTCLTCDKKTLTVNEKGHGCHFCKAGSYDPET